MNHSLEAVVGAKLLIHVVQMIAKRLRRDIELPRDLRRRPSLRERAQHPLFLLGQHRNWHEMLFLVRELCDLTRSLAQPLVECPPPSTRRDIVRYVNDQRRADSQRLEHENGDVEPDQ